MPCYEYVCPHCNTFEERIAPFEVEVIHCRRCGKIVRRNAVNTGVGVVYSGSGWTKQVKRDQ